MPPNSDVEEICKEIKCDLMENDEDANSLITFNAGKTSCSEF